LEWSDNMALVRTDYGLIYNTDGSLCATLLPEGGVAVEEGTNLLTTRTAPAQEVVAVSKGQKYTLSAYGNGNAMVYQQHVDDTQADWQQGTLSDGVVATAAGDLELWRPDMYGAFDVSLALVGKDGSSVAPLSGYIATLRPGEGRFGGAVAVEEGTTNIAHGKIIYDTTPPVPVPGYPNALAKYTTATLDLVMTLDPEVQAHSVQAWVYMAEDWDYKAWEFRFLLNDEIVGTISADLSKKGQWQHVKGTFVGSADRVQLRSASSGTRQRRWTAMVQIEEKSFATSFVAGTRERGRLMYPGVIPSNEGTLLIWAKKNTLEPGTKEKFRKILDAQSPRIDFQWRETGNLSANFGGANLSIPDPAQDLDWHQYAITYSGRTVKMYFDGQLVASGQAQEDLVNFSELCVGARWDGSGAGNALYDELLILPYAASEAEIQRWYVQGLPASGTCTSPVLDLSPVGTAAGSAISWNASIPGVVLGGSGIYSGRIAWSEGTNFPDPKPSYLPADKFSWMVEGQIIIPADGTYAFGLDSDDASDLFIDDQLVVSWYGGHGTAGSGGVPDFNLHNGAIALTAGLHTIRVRMTEGRGESGIAVGWKKPGDASFSIIPAEQFENLQYKWFSTEGLYDKIGHPTITEVMDYFFNEPDVTVETNLSLDGGVTWQGWQQATNGGPIPDISAGTDLSNAQLQTRVTLQTTDTTVTPRVDSLTVEIGHQASAVAGESLSQSSPLTFTAVGNRVRLVPSAGVTKWQLEQKTYAIPSVDGTRPDGILSYPELAKQFNQREFTFVAEWRPYSELGTGPSDTGNERFFHIDTGHNTQGNRYMLARIYNTQQLRFSVPRADGATEQHFSFQPSIYEANQWYFIACVLDVKSMKCRIHLNNEYQEFTLSGTPAMLDLQRFFLGCIGTGGQLNGELKNVQIINEALPIEVINNFLNPAN